MRDTAGSSGYVKVNQTGKNEPGLQPAVLKKNYMKLNRQMRNTNTYRQTFKNSPFLRIRGRFASKSHHCAYITDITDITEYNKWALQWQHICIIQNEQKSLTQWHYVFCCWVVKVQTHASWGNTRKEDKMWSLLRENKAKFQIRKMLGSGRIAHLYHLLLTRYFITYLPPAV